ncbi:HD domain-containing protein [Lactovum odontotermitis]
MINLEKISDFARAEHAENTDGHGFDHIERVAALAQRILLTEPAADTELVLTACYLHDTYDEKLTTDVPAQKARVHDFLADLTSPEFAGKTLEIIDNMSFSANLAGRQKLSLEGQIVQDADRLDAMGAWGITRALEYGWSHGRKLYDPSVRPAKLRSKADYRVRNDTTLNHFYEKLFLLKDLLNTAEAKRIGEERDLLMHDFVSAIEREYHESH